MALPKDLEPVASTHVWTPAEVAALTADEFGKHSADILRQTPAMGQKRAEQRSEGRRTSRAMTLAEYEADLKARGLSIGTV